MNIPTAIGGVIGAVVLAGVVTRLARAFLLKDTRLGPLAASAVAGVAFAAGATMIVDTIASPLLPTAEAAIFYATGAAFWFAVDAVAARPR